MLIRPNCPGHGRDPQVERRRQEPCGRRQGSLAHDARQEPCGQGGHDLFLEAGNGGLNHPKW